MRRREFFGLVGGMAAWPMAVRGQQPRAPRIGVLILGSAQPMATRVEALRKGLEELGYIDGQNIFIEIRWAEGRYERLPDLAAELVRLGVNVLVTHGTPGVRAAVQASATTPIVMAVSGDALATHLIDGLSRPGRNLTGSTFLSTELNAKRLEVIKDALPNVTRAAVLLNPKNIISKLVFEAVERTAAALAIRLKRYDIRDASDLDNSFAAMSKDGIEAIVTNEDIVVVTNAKPIADHARKRRIAVIAGNELIQAGGLISYDVNVPDLFRRAAVFTDKILKGVRVGDLPVELPTKYQMAINLKTARALGLVIPPTLIARADQVIE